MEEEVVEVELPVLGFAGDVRPKELTDRLDMRLAPREGRSDHLAHTAARVHATRVDVDEGRGSRDAHDLLPQAVLVPQEVHRISGVGGVEHREAGLDPEYF